MCFSSLDIDFFVRSGLKGIRLFQSVRFLENLNLKNVVGNDLYTFPTSCFLFAILCFLYNCKDTRRRVIPIALSLMKSLHCANAYLQQFSLTFKTLKTDKSLIQNEPNIRVLIL